MHPWEAWLGTRAVGQTESFAILTLASESPLLMTYFFHNIGEIVWQGSKLLCKVGRS